MPSNEPQEEPEELTTDEKAERLRNTLRRNKPQERKKASSKIIKRESRTGQVETATGEKVRLTKTEQEKYETLTTRQKFEAIQEFVFFKAQGTFRGSKPAPHSPYQTAGPFYSGGTLGGNIFPGDTTLEYLHRKLSRSLNDRHRVTGQIGDWRETHDPSYGGYWSFYVEKYARVAIPGNKRKRKGRKQQVTRNIPFYTDRQEGEIEK